MTDGTPGYWMFETSGVLRPTIEAYVHGKPLSAEQIVTFRAYLRQWMGGPWQGPQVDALRARLDTLTTRDAIDSWLDDALDIGIDPL